MQISVQKVGTTTQTPCPACGYVAPFDIYYEDGFINFQCESCSEAYTGYKVLPRDGGPQA